MCLFVHKYYSLLNQWQLYLIIQLYSLATESHHIRPSRDAVVCNTFWNTFWKLNFLYGLTTTAKIDLCQNRLLGYAICDDSLNMDLLHKQIKKRIRRPWRFSVQNTVATGSVAKSRGGVGRKMLTLLAAHSTGCIQFWTVRFFKSQKTQSSMSQMRTGLYKRFDLIFKACPKCKLSKGSVYVISCTTLELNRITVFFVDFWVI